jgi:hypothetical protein
VGLASFESSSDVVLLAFCGNGLSATIYGKRDRVATVATR